MSYHHLALAAKDMQAIHTFYEVVMGFELVKVEIAPVMGGGWGKHFFYRMDGDDSRFIAFWELMDTPGEGEYSFDLNEAAGTPQGTNHYSFAVNTAEELNGWRAKWNAAGLDVLEIDHNWCHSVYTRDPNGNMVEFCLTTGSFTAADRARALAALDETELNPSPPPAMMKQWLAKDA
ncbi:VOC family protein [Parasphingorhabdus flavimaris]|uniref:VOC family protein n=1 Tax=Parasphingorhabdus flavimaris TaxID=266812 RepID=A0ABX2N4F5_9SPHN|nr:VOC family protein [Parasphingorhabdus flavimaris]NVD28611.1 VOC family protein [Parasphingorhabdus flavimaris]